MSPPSQWPAREHLTSITEVGKVVAVAKGQTLPPATFHNGLPSFAPHTAVDLLVMVCGLIRDPEVGDFHARRFAARVPLTVLGQLGVAENAVRMALSRQVQRGLLTSQKSGRIVIYEMTDEGERMVSEAGLRVRGDRPFASTSTVWTLVSFSVPEARREFRNRLRHHLTQRGFRPLRDGLWLALDSFAAEPLLHDLDADLLANIELDIFIATPYHSTRLTEMIRRGWDIEDLRSRHESFLARWEHLELSEEFALPLLTLFAADWVDLLRHDPGLPAESLGTGWPGERSANTAARVYGALQQPAGTALRELLASIDPEAVAESGG